MKSIKTNISLGLLIMMSSFILIGFLVMIVLFLFGCGANKTYEDDGVIVVQNKNKDSISLLTLDFDTFFYEIVEAGLEKGITGEITFNSDWMINEIITIDSSKTKVLNYFGEPNYKINENSLCYFFDNDGIKSNDAVQKTTDYSLIVNFNKDKLENFVFSLPEAIVDTGRIKRYYKDFSTKYKEPYEPYLGCYLTILQIDQAIDSGKTAENMRNDESYYFDFVLYDKNISNEDLKPVINNMLEFFDTENPLSALANKVSVMKSVSKYRGSFEEGYISFTVENTTEFLKESYFSDKTLVSILVMTNLYGENLFTFNDTGFSFNWQG